MYRCGLPLSPPHRFPFNHARYRSGLQAKALHLLCLLSRLCPPQVAFTVLWILVTSQLGHYSKLYGPQVCSSAFVHALVVRQAGG